MDIYSIEDECNLETPIFRKLKRHFLLLLQFMEDKHTLHHMIDKNTCKSCDKSFEQCLRATKSLHCSNRRFLHGQEPAKPKIPLLSMGNNFMLGKSFKIPANRDNSGKNHIRKLKVAPEVPSSTRFWIFKRFIC